MLTSDFLAQYAIDRKQTNSVKWDGLEERFGQADLLALWVADMDFKVADSVEKAILNRAQHPVYGYTLVSPSYFEVYSQWHQSHFDYQILPEWVRFSPGVVQSLYWCLGAFTQVNDSVIIMPPVYYPFADAIRNTKRHLVTVDLINAEGQFKLDFAGFEEAIKANKVKAFIHCSPHNPAGRVWTAQEQAQLFEICRRHDVLIIADEIHQDFVFGDHQQVAAYNVAAGAYRDRLIILNSASKTFNLAALGHSSIVIPDDSLRLQYDTYATSHIVSTSNLFGQIALEAAYQDQSGWFDALKEVIYQNYQTLRDQLKQALPDIVVYPLEGTYLALLDLNPILKDRDCKAFIQDACGLAIDFGEWFGQGYEGYIRINLATHPKHIQEACQRIIANA